MPLSQKVSEITEVMVSAHISPSAWSASSFTHPFFNKEGVSGFRHYRGAACGSRINSVREDADHRMIFAPDFEGASASLQADSNGPR